MISGRNRCVLRHGREGTQQINGSVVADQILVAGFHIRQLAVIHQLTQESLADRKAVFVQALMDLVDGTDVTGHTIRSPSGFILSVISEQRHPI